MTSSMMRFGSTVLLAVGIGLLIWLKPNWTIEGFTARQTLYTAGGIFIFAIMYLTLQGYPISHGDAGAVSNHNLDNMMSSLPAVVALFGIAAHLFGWWPLGELNLFIVFVVLATSFYDLYILGGAAWKITLLTDETKIIR